MSVSAIRRRFVRHSLLLLAFVLPSCARVGLEPDQVDVLFGLDARRVPLAEAAPATVALGASLLEWRFARGSCASCHEAGGARVHEGHSAPALVDVGRALRYGWRGQETDLATFVRREFARVGIGDDAAVRKLVATEPEFARRLVGRAPTLDTLATAVVGALVARRSDGAWERYVAGDERALSSDARHGLATFVEVGCAACHGSRTLGGVSTHELGLAHAYPPGGMWRAPPLRNVAHTEPYLHDDSVATLAETVELMAWHELGVELDDRRTASIVTFLEEIGRTDT